MFYPNILMMAIEIRQSLLGAIDPKKKKRVYEDTLPFEASKKEMGKLFDEICDALEFDEEDKDTFAFHVRHIDAFNGQLSSNLQSYNASQEKFLWLILAYSIVPGISRIVTYWSQGPEVLDKGMPGGYFWFIPTLECDQNRALFIRMPVPKVIEWLSDLLGDNAQEQIIMHARTDNDSALRTLNNWKSGDSLPDIKKIREYFSDKASFEFKGCFQVDKNLPINDKVKQAIAFMNEKDMAPEELAKQIPEEEESIRKFLEGKLDDESNQGMVESLSVRYAKPTNKRIRQVLTFARMMQDGYQRLVNYLQPNVNCYSPGEENKVLQLIGLFQYIYNVANDAYNDARDHEILCYKQRIPSPSVEELEKKHFEDMISPELKSAACVSLIQSKGSCIEILTNLINKKTIDENKADDLENIYSNPNVNLKNRDDFEVLRNRIECMKKDERGLKLLKNHYLKQFEELAVTNKQKIIFLYNKLDFHLKEDSRLQETIQGLINSLDTFTSEELGSYKPGFLRFKAHHALFQNKFKDARDLLKASFEASKDHHIGELQYSIVMDLWGIILKNGKLNSKNDDRYYRSVLAHMRAPIMKIPYSSLMPEEVLKFLKKEAKEEGGDEMCIENITFEVPTIKDVSEQAKKHFWDTLYKPYKGYDSDSRPSK